MLDDAEDIVEVSNKVLSRMLGRSIDIVLLFEQEYCGNCEYYTNFCISSEIQNSNICSHDLCPVTSTGEPCPYFKPWIVPL